MRKATIALAAVLAVCVSTGADAAKKKKAAAAKPPAQTAADLNAGSTKFVGDAFSQMLVPAQSMAKPAAAPAKAATKKSKKKKA